MKLMIESNMWSAFLPVPLPGFCLPKNKVPCCDATGPYVASQLCEICMINSCFFHKILTDVAIHLRIRSRSNRSIVPSLGAWNVERLRAGCRGSRQTHTSTLDAGTPEPLLPARDHVTIVDVVRNATFECGDHGTGGPGHPLPKLAALGVGGGMGGQQDPVTELAQQRVHRQR